MLRLTVHDGLDIWVIYRRPRDLPGVEYAVRKQVAGAGGISISKEVFVALNLDGARRHIPPGLIRMDRQSGDDPVIVETWF